MAFFLQNLCAGSRLRIENNNSQESPTSMYTQLCSAAALVPDPYNILHPPLLHLTKTRPPWRVLWSNHITELVCFVFSRRREHADTAPPGFLSLWGSTRFARVCTSQRLLDQAGQEEARHRASGFSRLHLHRVFHLGQPSRFTHHQRCTPIVRSYGSPCTPHGIRRTATVVRLVARRRGLWSSSSSERL